MLAPERFAEWMSKHEHKDRRHGYVYNYHPRSDAHSVALCEFILDDLLEACTALRSQAERGEIAYGVNLKHTWSSTGKTKTLDLAIGLPSTPPHMALMKGRMRAVNARAWSCALLRMRRPRHPRSVFRGHGAARWMAVPGV